MAPLEPLTLTVQLKTPIPAGDRSLGSPVYSPGNTEGGPQFYKDFMDCLHGADGNPIPLDVLGLDDELRELVSDLNKSLTNVDEMSFDGIADQHWR
eukprot:scaffold255400_cov51-Attheya_sp.AAC.1